VASAQKDTVAVSASQLAQRAKVRLNGAMKMFDRKPLVLSAAEREQLGRAIARDRPELAAPLSGPIVQTELLLQDLFPRQRVFIVEAPGFHSAQIHVAWLRSGEMLVLTGHVKNFCALAAADPPAGLSDPKIATEYAEQASDWTATSQFGALRIGSVDEIPWFAKPSADDQARIDEVRAAFAARIAPQKLFASAFTYELVYWLIDNQRLIERTLVVYPNGQFACNDQVHAQGLPIPQGRYWGTVNGRIVPVG
jgi:hypothetical protein